MSNFEERLEGGLGSNSLSKVPGRFGRSVSFNVPTMPEDTQECQTRKSFAPVGFPSHEKSWDEDDDYLSSDEFYHDDPHTVHNAKVTVENQIPGAQNNSAVFLRQLSKNFSRKRTLSVEELEQGARTHYKQNSQNFGQLVPVNDETLVNKEVVDVEGQPRKPTESAKDSKGGGKPPQKERSRLELIILEQNWLSVYKRLFFVSFVINFIMLVTAASGHLPYAKANAALFSVANVLMVVLARNEVFLRMVFWLAVKVLGYKWVPLRLKTMTTAFLQSVGGIHSGCGLSAIIWLMYALVETHRNRGQSSAEILGVAWGILFLLIFSCLAAFPVFRHIHHNFFERTHRFAGWSSLALVFAFIILEDIWDPSTQKYHFSQNSIHKMQSIWYATATAIMIILPWISVRRVSVNVVVPPTKLNSLLYFKGGVKPGILARISPSPFSEWHAFGIISDGQDGHTILAGAVGDFTKGLAENPPTHIWVRTFHFAGLPYLTNMYNKAILVATGSGICVFMSFLLQSTRADVHVIWIAKNIRVNYGESIWEVVRETPSDRFTVIDTAETGRPKTKELVVTKAREFQAEVVIVTSNPSGTNEIVTGCNEAGIPAFGPIWDS